MGWDSMIALILIIFITIDMVAATTSLAPQYSCPEIEVDFGGYDIDSNHNIKSWHDCGTMCEIQSSCSFWTWNKRTKVCYLKSSDHGLHHAPDGISGVKGCK